MRKKKLVVLSGAGISAESGIPTFRDANGLWEGHDIQEVATPQGWQKNPDLVLEFYNQRRVAANKCQPNDAHKILVELEANFDVVIITQNVDNLHEKAGSKNVLHLHGELNKVRSTQYPHLIFDIQEINPTSLEIKKGDVCPKGSQLRPHIVWFGEAVPMIEKAAEVSSQADIFVVVGTSMAVYPAAGLIDYVDINVEKYIIDPHIPELTNTNNIIPIPEKASVGMKKLKQLLLG